MKKTLSINLGGMAFHIDEDAYDKLHRYLEAIRSHFKGFDGKEELMNDIETRIAEILQAKLSSDKEVITIKDIDEMIDVMGQPSDYAMEDEQAEGQQGSYYYTPKRLYRDPERKVFGGICSGLGAYFNLDPVWVRLIFLVSILISGGFGLILYLILWIVVPEARTTAERMEMRGEPVNISNIEKTFKDEVHQIKDRLSDMSSRARRNYRARREEFRTGYQGQFRDGMNGFGRVLVRALVIFAGFIILMIGLGLTVAYLSVLFKFPVYTVIDHAGVQVFPLYSVIERVFANDADLRTFSTGLMIVIGIPLLMLLWAGIRMIFGLARARTVSGMAAIIWICAFIITVIFGFKVADSFRIRGEQETETVLNIQRNDTLHIATMKTLPEHYQWGREGIFYFPEMRTVVTNSDKVIFGIPLLRIKPSKDTIARLVINKKARGSDVNDASERADQIIYNWKIIGDSLYLPDHFSIPDNDRWRQQETRVELELPEGTHVTMNKETSPILGYHKNISREDLRGTLFVMDNRGLVESR